MKPPRRSIGNALAQFTAKVQNPTQASSGSHGRMTRKRLTTTSNSDQSTLIRLLKRSNRASMDLSPKYVMWKRSDTICRRLGFVMAGAAFAEVATAINSRYSPSTEEIGPMSLAFFTMNLPVSPAMILAERVGAWAAVAIFRAHSGTRETLYHGGRTCKTRITSVLACSRTGVLTGRERWRRVVNPRISCLATCFSPPVVLRLCGSSVCLNCQNGSSNDSLVGGRSWNLHWT